MRISVIIVICITLVFASPNYERTPKRTAQSIINSNNIDEDSKSIKGWIRIFNSKEKTLDYGYSLSVDERRTLLLYMKEKNLAKMKKYSRGIN